MAGPIFAIAACGSAGVVAPTVTSAPDVTTTAVPIQPGLAITTDGGVDLHASVAGPVMLTAMEGLPLPVIETSGVWYEVVTTCGTEAWVRADDVEVAYPSRPQVPGPGFDLAEAVVVVDPGHGGRDLGAKGASGTWESHINLEIAGLLKDRLSGATDVDWASGEVRSGGEYPAVESVRLTRDPLGPLGGNIELSLAYRAEFANALGADALVAIHNNTTPARMSDIPGSDVFYSVGSAGSDRLASLIHEELMRGLGELGTRFGRAKITGVKTRVYADTGEDFYGLLRQTLAPSVIVEGLYISEAAEEAILSSSRGQQAYADAVYRGLIRFLTTDDVGSAIQEPVPFDGDVGTVTNDACEIPSQP